MPDSAPSGVPPRRGWVRYQVALALCAAAAVSYICRNTISVAESTIRSDLGLTKEETGILMGAFFLPYALGQIPAGLIAHRKGTRYALPLFAMGWSAATLMFGMAHTLAGLIAARAGMGLSQAGIFSSATQTIARWFPRSERAFPNGALGSAMSLGGALGAWIAGYLIVDERVGWRGMFLLFSLPGFLFAPWFLYWFRNQPEEHDRVTRSELAHIQSGRNDTGETAAAVAEPTPWRRLLSSRATQWICLQQFCRAGAVMFFFSWFATYLQERHKMDIPKSGFLSMLPSLGIFAGAALGGAVMDWIYRRTGSLWHSRNGVAIGASLVCAAFTLLAIFVEGTTPAVLLISAGSLFAGATGPCGYTITVDKGGRQVAPLFATMNMVGNVGALAFTVLVPLVERAVGWNGVMVCFAVLFVLSAFCWWRINPSGTVLEEPTTTPSSHAAR